MTDIKPYGSGGSDTPDKLTLAVENNPTIREGDTLRVQPDVGKAYRGKVLSINPDGVKVRIPSDPGASPRPAGSQKRTFPAEELERFYIEGLLHINPPKPPTRMRGV